MRKILIVAILLGSINIFSQERIIKTQAPFLTIPLDAKGSGVGETGAATDADLYSIYWNPAKYTAIADGMGISFSYVPWLRNLQVSDLNLTALTGYYKINDNQVLAFNFTYFGMGEINCTDEKGNPINNYTPNEFALAVCYAQKITDNLSLGGTFRYIYSDLAGNATFSDKTVAQSANAFAADFGLYYSRDFTLSDKKAKWAAGFNISNIGSKISYTNNDKSAQPIPTMFRLGGALTTEVSPQNYLNFSVDFIKLMVPTPKNAKDNPSYNVVEGMFRSFTDAPDGFSEEMQEITPSFGLEYNYFNVFFARLGYLHENEKKGNRKFATLGVGLKYNVFNFDVSYYKPVTDQESPLKDQLKFSIAINFNKPKSDEAASPVSTRYSTKSKKGK